MDQSDLGRSRDETDKDGSDVRLFWRGEGGGGRRGKGRMMRDMIWEWMSRKKSEK